MSYLWKSRGWISFDDGMQIQFRSSSNVYYGSKVRGVSKSGLQDLDRVSLRHMRWVLRVEATTQIFAVYGGCGHPHPTPILHHMPDAPFELQGFTNWITKALDLAKTYNIDIKLAKTCFRHVCNHEIKKHFINEWRMSIQNTTFNSILWKYNVLKTRFGTEPYLRSVKDIKYLVASYKLCVRCHALR